MSSLNFKVFINLVSISEKIPSDFDSELLEAA